MLLFLLEEKSYPCETVSLEFKRDTCVEQTGKRKTIHHCCIYFGFVIIYIFALDTKGNDSLACILYQLGNFGFVTSCS